MIDYREWIERAMQFLETTRLLPGLVGGNNQVSPPLTKDELERLELTLPLKLPTPLRRFLLEGSSSCYLWYFWEPRRLFIKRVQSVLSGANTVGGELYLCDASQFQEYQQACLDLAPLQEGSDRLIWENAIPFAAVPCGDYLALRPDIDPHNPPVAYLSHDRGGHSRIISTNYDQFLLDWEQIHFVGPDISTIASFLHPQTGYLDPTLPSKGELDRLFIEAQSS